MNALLILLLTAPSMLSVSPLHNRHGWLGFALILPSWLTGRLKKNHFCILSISPDITVMVNWVKKQNKQQQQKLVPPFLRPEEVTAKSHTGRAVTAASLAFSSCSGGGSTEPPGQQHRPRRLRSAV